MSTCACSILIALVSLSQYPERGIADPLADYVPADGGWPGDQKLLWIAADLDGDERTDYAVSDSNATNARAGFIWSFYLGAEDGTFTLIRDLASFRADALYIGSYEGFDGPAIVSYHPDTADEGALGAIQIRDGSVIETTIRRIRPLEEDQELVREIFAKKSTQPQFLDRNGLIAKGLLKDDSKSESSTPGADKMNQAAEPEGLEVPAEDKAAEASPPDAESSSSSAESRADTSIEIPVGSEADGAPLSSSSSYSQIVLFGGCVLIAVLGATILVRRQRRSK